MSKKCMKGFLTPPKDLNFNPQTVEERNKLQTSGFVHPYTCGNDKCRGETNGAPLLATEEGWVCIHCGYNQKYG